MNDRFLKRESMRSAQRPSPPGPVSSQGVWYYTFRAHLADVYILPVARGLGLGRALIEAILAHPELTTVRNWTLTTADAQGLYARYGFRPGEADSKWMTLDRTPVEPD